MHPSLLKHYYETVKHKWHVHRFIWKTCVALLKRSFVHDLSKFSSAEAELFADVTAQLSNTSYGSDDYYKQLKRLKPALDHHYQHNTHHPEHFEGGLPEMEILDVIEMLCDWKAASLRHNDGDVESSIEHNKSRFGYTEGLAHKMRQFFAEIDP